METQRVPASVCSSRQGILKYIRQAADKAPDVLYEFELSSALVDRELVRSLSEIYCSLDIHVTEEMAAGGEKSISRKSALLNDAGLVFGFVYDAALAQTKGTLSIKQIRSVMDFLLLQYPNHIQFNGDGLKSTAVLSTQDISTVKCFFHAAETFYTWGRAVPWFLTVLAPLKLKPSVFLGDFAEWQRCNNCGPSSGFSAIDEPHVEIEKMVLHFVKLKYEEKHLPYVYPAAEDMIRLHGAFARAAAEETETVLDLSYTPEDIFSPYAQDLKEFAGEVCMEACSVRVFSGREGPDFTYLK